MRRIIRSVPPVVLLALAAGTAVAQSADGGAAPAQTDAAAPRSIAAAVAQPRDDAAAAAGSSGSGAANSEARRSRVGDVAPAVDTLDLGTTSITGNQELPKVLYIVPWKSSDLGDLAGRPVETLLDEVLAPVDPREFERHLSYYTALYGDGDSASGAAASGRSEKE
jgi:hypothetical protein